MVTMKNPFAAAGKVMVTDTEYNIYFNCLKVQVTKFGYICT